MQFSKKTQGFKYHLQQSIWVWFCLAGMLFLSFCSIWFWLLMCGCWLDICTIRRFGKSMAQRVEFFSVSPLAIFFVHWVFGIFYMLQISILVSLLRGVLRNGVLYFLRDPVDSNHNPYRDLIDDPVYNHALRALQSVAVYGNWIVMLVYLPVKLEMRMAPSIFPQIISRSVWWQKQGS